MKVVIDIEANGLKNPDRIWVIVCKEIESGRTEIFRNVTTVPSERLRFLEYANGVGTWIGHNWLGYDYPVLERLIDLRIDEVDQRSIDTLIISKLVDFPRNGHSVEDYGVEFGLPKISFTDFHKYSQAMEDYCIRDVEITEKIYRKYARYIAHPERQDSIRLEHWFQWNVIAALENNGFAFNTAKAQQYLKKVETELATLDADILSAFPAKLKMIREVTPRATKHGTISLSSIPKDMRPYVSDMVVDAPFCFCHWSDFNPSSHKQIINLLNEAGWKPVDKTNTHKDLERELAKLEKDRKRDRSLDTRYQEVYTRLQELRKQGWKVNENNLETLPSSAPDPARLLAKRITVESRRRTLTEWRELVDPDNRIRGKFYGIGAWTHRMAHQNPNTANIPNELDTSGKKKYLGKELRSLWCAPPKRLLVGVDAEGIQLRIFAHYINDPEFTHSLVNGKKEDKSDPHSLNQRILGNACKTRAAAKRYIYALLLGAGMGKLREILECDEETALRAYDRLLERYTGFAYLKSEVIPADAKRGWFVGLDGRAVRIPGETVGARRHLAMSGYLQNGEAVIMKRATKLWWPHLKENDAMLVNFVHDEWQTEVPNNFEIALRIARLQADAIKQVGEDLKLLCPLAGSYWNDDTKDYTIDINWSKTH